MFLDWLEDLHLLNARITSSDNLNAVLDMFPWQFIQLIARNIPVIMWFECDKYTRKNHCWFLADPKSQLIRTFSWSCEWFFFQITHCQNQPRCAVLFVMFAIIKYLESYFNVSIPTFDNSDWQSMIFEKYTLDKCWFSLVIDGNSFAPSLVLPLNLL